MSSTDFLQSKQTFNIVEEDDDNDNELNSPPLELLELEETTDGTSPCMDLGRSYLPRVLDLLSLTLKNIIS